MLVMFATQQNRLVNLFHIVLLLLKVVLNYLLHMDIWGPYHIASLFGAKYFLTIVDDYSRSVWTFLMQNKTQAIKLIVNFIKYVSNQFDTRIKIIRTDNGSEFVGLECQEIFSNNGILHQWSGPYTPQQNGVVERKHRHLLQVARALLHQSGLPQKILGGGSPYSNTCDIPTRPIPMWCDN